MIKKFRLLNCCYFNLPLLLYNEYLFLEKDIKYFLIIDLMYLASAILGKLIRRCLYFNNYSIEFSKYIKVIVQYFILNWNFV